MLLLNRQALPPAAADRIRRWLGAEGSGEFYQWLLTQSALHAAEAANLMCCKDDPGLKVEEASQEAEMANIFTRFFELCQKQRNPDSQFETVEITPKPATNTSLKE